jgi:hypothetical protein
VTDVGNSLNLKRIVRVAKMWLGIGLLVSFLGSSVFAAAIGQLLGDIFKFKLRPLPTPKSVEDT